MAACASLGVARGVYCSADLPRLRPEFVSGLLDFFVGQGGVLADRVVSIITAIDKIGYTNTEMLQIYN